jgi:hypothetical protein
MTMRPATRGGKFAAVLGTTAVACGLLLAAGTAPALGQQVRGTRDLAVAPAGVARPALTAGTHDIDKECLPVSAPGGPAGTVCVMLHVRETLRSDEFWPKVTFEIKSGSLSKVSVARLYLLVCSTDPATGTTSCGAVNSERAVAHPKAGSKSADVVASKGYRPTGGVPISIGGAVGIESCLYDAGGKSACFPGYGCSTATPQIQCRTDPLIFADSLAAFQSVRNKACAGDLPDCDKKSGNSHGKHLNWSSDGCSLPMPVKKYGQNPFGWPYRKACERHDFGYRNYVEQKRCTNSPNGGSRKLIDRVFLSDLRGICADVKARKRCNALAVVYYNAVRRFGHC